MMPNTEFEQLLANRQSAPRFSPPAAAPVQQISQPMAMRPPPVYHHAPPVQGPSSTPTHHTVIRYASAASQQVQGPPQQVVRLEFVHYI